MSGFQPKRFGKYLLLDNMATGGMAQLFLAKIIGIQGFEKLIAIKMILPHFAREKELVSSFIDEAKLAALLNHQNIVQIYDFGNIEDSYFISMEYLLGKDLRAIWHKAKEKDRPISLENALYIVSRACSGLSYAHELKDFQGKPLSIIHRDISPQNIFVTYQGDVKILDFGIAKAASQSTVTQFGMIKGKVAYMSPEQAAGKAIDQRSDLFSLGIVLYELITQNRMFTGDSTMQILTKVREAEYDSPESVSAGLPAKVYAIINHAIAKEPEQRYQSCSEMLADLEECMAELSLRRTARGLGLYMKDLFEEEIAGEDRTIRELSGLGRTEEKETPPPLPPEPVPQQAASGPAPSQPEPSKEKRPSGTGAPEPSEEAERPPTAGELPLDLAESAPKKKGAPRRAPLYAGIGALIVVAILAFSFWPKNRAPSPAPENKTVSRPATASPSPASPAPTAPQAVPNKPQPGTAQKTEEIKEKIAALQKAAGEATDRDPQKAKSLLLQAIELDPASIQTNFRLGLVYVRMMEYPKAIEIYNKVAQMDPQFPDIYFNLGFAYAMNKDYPKAEEMYDRVVKLTPRYLDEALFNLATVQQREGKRNEAIANMEKALSVNPKNAAIKESLEKLKRGGERKK
ncbi:MAG: protein kinase [Syntrophorhabdales bacterium]|jgi:serine/threonine protein kinase/Tfp pilus assembly protein PilF